MAYENKDNRKHHAGRQNNKERFTERQTKRSENGSVRLPKYESEQKSYKNYEYQTDQTGLNENRTDRTEDENKYILTGRNPIREALKNHHDLEKMLVQRGELSGSAKEIVQKAKEQKVQIQIVDKSRLDAIAPNHQGLIAFSSAYQYSTVEEILAYAAQKNEKPFIVILDGITDPHNLGAVMRTAECTGVHGIIIPQHRSVGLTPSAVKSSDCPPQL